MPSKIYISLVGVMVCVLAMAAPTAAREGPLLTQRGGHARVVNATCKTPKLDFTSSDASIFTSSQTYVDVSEGSVTFNQARTGCILVRFDAVTRVQGSTVEFVTALLDGTQMFPGEMPFDGDDEQVPQSRATSWVATNVSAGSHTVFTPRPSGIGDGLLANVKAALLRLCFAADRAARPGKPTLRRLTGLLGNGRPFSCLLSG